ncbi:MAG: serine/threonine-protein kinase [Acidobacteria bacterium]|nr:serine/threonine-protein kinase [Acidobacteriota bacterium]
MLSGTKLGRYEIRQKIGTGGMGEVFLAHDSQLNRNVALKVLLPEFCLDLERVQRFKFEAKAASALNHPNIITIHEIDETDKKLFIATEFVDGETLREKIERGDLTFLDSIRIAEQVADALAIAHTAHIIHRDIKPENIMIRRDGYAKILDFGLAKPFQHQAIGAEDKTIHMVKTQPGMVLGSVRYMSPEQARGKETDERTDIWSLGVVLYEMLTGKNPFEGETVSDSLAAVIHLEAEPIEGVPEELHWIIRKSLKKDAAERYQNIKDFALDLKDLRVQTERNSDENKAASFVKTTILGNLDTSENKTLIHRTLSAENTTDAQKKGLRPTHLNTGENQKNWGYLSLGFLVLAAIVVFSAWWFRPAIFGKPQPVFSSPQVSRLTEDGKSRLPEISPDGKYIAFVNSDSGMNSLKVRQVATDSTVQIVPPMNLEFKRPTFSPDGSYVFYNSVDEGVGTVYQIPTLGGTAKKIIADVDTKISFSPDGKQFIFARHNPNKGGDTVIIANSDGSNPQPFITNQDAGYDMITEAVWSPDGEKILLGALKRNGGDLDRVNILAISVKDKKMQVVGEKTWIGASSLNWLKNGSGIVFIAKNEPVESSQIWHLSFPEGEARQITNDISDYVSLSLADDGKTMITTKVDNISSFWTFAPNTKELKQLTAESRNYAGFSGIEPAANGKIYYTRRNGEEVNVWEADEDGKNEKQITSDSLINIGPAVSKDGKFLVFSSNRKSDFRIWRTDIDGKNPVQLSSESNGGDFKPQLSSDGQTVVFMRQSKNGGKSVLMKVSTSGGEVKSLLPENEFSQMLPKISYNGKHIAYFSFKFDEQTLALQNKLTICAFDGKEIGKVEKEIQTSLGKKFAWSPDGKSLTFINSEGTPNLWNYPLDKSKPKPLTDFNSGKIVDFSWSSDGKKLFIVRGIVSSDLVLIKDNAKV